MMRRLFKFLLRLGLAAGLVMGAVIFMSWGMWERVFRLNYANWKFESRFPGSFKPYKLDAPAKAGLTRALIGALADPDPQTRKLAGFALGRIGPEAGSAVPALIERLASNVFEDRLGAAYALEGIARMDAPSSVQGTMTEPALLWRARKALLRLGTPEGDRAARTLPSECPSELKSPVDWCE